MHLLVVVLLGILYPICARSENRFRRPPGPGPTGDYRDNPVYTLGDKIDLQWEMSFKSMDLVLWQQQPKGNTKPAYSRLAGEFAEKGLGKLGVVCLAVPGADGRQKVNSKAKSLVWTVGYAGFPSHHDPDLSPVYFLQLLRTGETVGSATSHYFNITEPEGTTSASSARTATLSSKTASGPTSTPAASTTLALAPAIATSSSTPTPTPTPTPSASPAAPASQLPSGAVAGIAVGGTLAALALLVFAAWTVRRHVQRQNAAVHTHGDIVMYAERQLREKGAVPWRSSPPPHWKTGLPAESHETFEVEASETRYEMAADPVVVESKTVRPWSMGSRSRRWG
ncbi:hypothetical protein CI238_12988 [Colletotrichum incanum]|uniref:Uncharacterized protein n=1 Tax=Colletotrichum incanum TaxID=1573173 RepID=A0A161X378_COLIC|nr:hypothetical protein CI238_12988 [Colletotrichum incanum]OHW96599.1 hypothetical protein CSPAE12_04633 [Colletotrichum incanum]